MTGWLLPVAGAAFWGGLLAWPVVGWLASPLEWLAVGVSVLVAAVVTAPTRTETAGPLDMAGLVPEAAEEPALAALAPSRLRAGRGPPWFPAFLVVNSVLLLGVGWAGVHERRVEGSLLARLAPAHVEVSGTFRTDPSAGSYGWSAILDVRDVRWPDGDVSLRAPVWVQGSGDVPPAVRGDRVLISGELSRPGDPGFARSLEERGMAAELRAASFERLGSSSNPVIRAAQAFRAFVGSSIRRLFPEREAGLLMGLALGDDSRLDPALARDFQATGLGHLLVVSGENVAMVLGPVLALGMALRLSRWPRFALGISTVVFFVVLTGAEPSVMRAGVMAGLTLLGVFLGRPRSAASILGGAVLLLLVLDPTLVWAIGFQLSVSATAGMVALASPLAERLRFLPRPIALAAGTTLAAQLGVTPILLFHFREVPGVTLAANLLAFPAVSPALVVGLLAAGAGLGFAPAGRLLAAIALLPMRYLETVADRLAKAPVPWITSRGGAAPLVAGGAVVVGAAWWLRSGRRLPKPAIVAGALILPLFVWSSALSAARPSGLVVRFFDVGQGDAALVTSPEGATILIDAGPDPEQVATKLSSLGVKRIDVAVATHPHADHVAGFPAVFARFPVGLVLDPGCDEPSPAYADYLQAVADEHLLVAHPRAGDTYTAGGIRLDILGPWACAHGTNSDPNNDSLVIRMSYREDVVMFAADAEEPLQQQILDAGESVAAEVLKCPHHGGATSLVDFLNAVDPELAVVSVGPNDYGHPVPEVLDELRATGARVMRTDRAGDVTVTFTAQGLFIRSDG